MLVLFPFETRFYDEAGVPVTFVGHPVAEDAPAASAVDLRERAGLHRDRPVVALLPGSRRSEVARLLPVMLGAARLLRGRRPDLQFLLPLAPDLRREWVEGIVGDSGATGVRLHQGDFPQILRVCATGVVASGTASLEAAVVGLPMVVVYRMGPLSYLVGPLLVRVEHIALPNLVAGRRVVPELVQGECTPRAVAERVGRFLDHPEAAARVRAELAQVRQRLGGPGVFERAAEAVLAELERGGRVVSAEDVLK
jgi:lipid-A-disaccharide synthase